MKRTEIVTGGASATYGADAVAGVVNLILDTKFEGFHADISGGISEYGDDANVVASGKYGDSFAGGRGHFLAGVEVQKDWGAGGCFSRPYCAVLTNYPINPGYIGGKSTNGLPANLVLPGVTFVYSPSGALVSAVQTVGGVKTTLGQQINNTGATLLPAALQGLQFNAAATGWCRSPTAITSAAPSCSMATRSPRQASLASAMCRSSPRPATFRRWPMSTMT